MDGIEPHMSFIYLGEKYMIGWISSGYSLVGFWTTEFNII